MSTVDQIKMQKIQQRNLDQAGYHLDIINHPSPKAQWYRDVEGWWVALPNLLPADPYHLNRYLQRGFTMTPEPDKVRTLTEIREPLTEITEPLVAAAIVVETEAPAVHSHTFRRALGSLCKTAGCTAVRKTAFQSRRKRLNKEGVTIAEPLNIGDGGALNP